MYYIINVINYSIEAALLHKSTVRIELLDADGASLG